MGDDILARVIEVERELQQQILLEERKAAQWIDQLRNESEASLRQEEEALRDGLDQAVGRAQREAEAMASSMIEDARRAAERLQEVDEGDLQEVVRENIRRILPEGMP